MELLSGNEAIAQGAWEAGVSVGVGYPGTPSTETMEAFAAKDAAYAEWCPNEKVAVEVGLGASAAGVRVLATMKHVGVNVAADPLFTAAYTGINGGMLVLAADDPGMHSSQNEQDSRYYAQAARVPILEPSDSQEAYTFAKAAYDLSEKFDLPFMMRSTVRISHAKTPVDIEGKQHKVERKPYEKDPSKWVMMPAYAKSRRLSLDARIDAVSEWTEQTSFNRIEINDTAVGVVCSGAAYYYVRDALPEASVFKVGVPWPFPAQKLAEFASRVDHLYCIDEASTYLSDQMRIAGVAPEPTPSPLPAAGELSQRAIALAFNKDVQDARPPETDLPGRPPALCAGCPHRLVFKELMRAKCIVTGDIGCYTLGALPPLAALDSTVDMGASISMAHGFELAFADEENHQPVVGVIGDSTFTHSGLTSLLNTVYNQGSGTICILDNRTTGMTGHQGNPVNGKTLQGRITRELDLEQVVRSLGVEDVHTINPNDMKATRTAIKEAIAATDTLSVLIFRSPCVLLRDSFTPSNPYFVNGSCTGCGSCISLGCPAIAKDPDTGWATIQSDMCVGCGQCSQYCGFDAIEVLEGGR